MYFKYIAHVEVPKRKKENVSTESKAKREKKESWEELEPEPRTPKKNSQFGSADAASASPRTLQTPRTPRTPGIPLMEASEHTTPITPTSPSLSSMPFCPKTPIRPGSITAKPIDYTFGFKIDRKIGEGSLMTVHSLSKTNQVLNIPKEEHVRSTAAQDKFKEWICSAFEEQWYLQKAGIPSLPFLNSKQDAMSYLRVVQAYVPAEEFLENVSKSPQQRATLVMPLFLKMIEVWGTEGYRPLDLDPGNIRYKSGQLTLTDTLSGGLAELDQFAVFFNTWHSQGRYAFSVDQMMALRDKAVQVSTHSPDTNTQNACRHLIEALYRHIQKEIVLACPEGKSGENFID